MICYPQFLSPSVNKTCVIDVFPGAEDCWTQPQPCPLDSARGFGASWGKASHLTCFVCAGIWNILIEAFVFVWALEELQTGDKRLHCPLLKQVHYRGIKLLNFLAMGSATCRAKQKERWSIRDQKVKNDWPWIPPAWDNNFPCSTIHDEIRLKHRAQHQRQLTKLSV